MPFLTTLFDIFLEKITSDALEKHDSRTITNLQFADDIDVLAEKEQEQEALIESLDNTCTRFK